MIRPLFGWLRGRTTTEPTLPEQSDGASPALRKDVDANEEGRSGRVAGRREVAAIEALRHTTFVDREQAALHTQLARAPRDVGALYGLLAWHARRGESAEMASFAHALWDETDAEGELWRRAAALGRSVDPHNPLYDEDPFAALSAHAALQPITASLALDAFDLSLPMGDVCDVNSASADLLADASWAGTDRALSGPDRVWAATRAVQKTQEAQAVQHASIGAMQAPDGNAAPLTDKPFFDIFSKPNGQLPASVLNLDMDLDTPPTGGSMWLAGLSGDAVDRAEPAQQPAQQTTQQPTQQSTQQPATQSALQPAWMLARPRRVRGRAGGIISHRSKK